MKIPTLSRLKKSIKDYFDLNQRRAKHTYCVTLSDSDAKFLEDTCSHMIVTPEKFIENLIAIRVRPKDSGFRIITKKGILIDSEGKSINEYWHEQLSKEIK